MDATQQGGRRRIGSPAIRGGSLLAAGTVVERIARLIRNMLLARIIAPDQFGLMAMVLAVLALLEAVTEVGVAQAVIQNKRGTSAEFLNVAWWFGVARGVIIAALALPLARPVAAFYDLPELAPLLMVAPISVVLVGLTSPRIYALQREFRFGATLVSIQGAGLLATGATIALGLWLENVWALLWGTIIEAFLRFVFSFAVAPFRPSLRWDGTARRELFLFTRGMAGLSLMTFLMMQADTFVLGKTVSVQELGLYTMAIALAAFPLTVFSKVVQPLVVPLLAPHQDDVPAMRHNVLRLSRLVWLFGLPMAAIMAAVSEPLLVLVYGRPEFSEAAPAFSVYVVFIVVYMASMVTFSVYLAIAQPQLQRRFTVTRAALLVLLLYPMALQWGGTGAATALLLAMLGAMAVQLLTLRRVIGLGAGRYLRTIRAGLLVAVGPGLLLLVVSSVADLRHWAIVILAAVVGALTWGALLLREGHEIRTVRAGAALEVTRHPVP